jgi:hypothetical protein
MVRDTMLNCCRAASVVGLLAVPLAAVQPSSDSRTLTGHITVTTSASGRTAAVVVKKDATTKDVESFFCVDLAPPAPPKLAFAGPGRVMYRPRPPMKVPAGIKIEGPEAIFSALAVVPAEGKGWLFVRKGDNPLLTAEDPALVGLVSVNVRTVSRRDWIGDDGQRRGTDLEGCLAPAG